ncbi:MAG: hypothetical protein H8E53_02795, partial [Planctomycetes bacterium]|nr:hypothetical protein [Planctomycetota bacterium]
MPDFSQYYAVVQCSYLRGVDVRGNRNRGPLVQFHCLDGGVFSQGVTLFVHEGIEAFHQLPHFLLLSLQPFVEQFALFGRGEAFQMLLPALLHDLTAILGGSQSGLQL